jgi:uncharacterized protein
MISTTETVSPGQRSGRTLVRSVDDLHGPAGRLEAILNEGSPEARFAALRCHPHPKGGGNLHNKVVYHAMKALNAPESGLGWPVLRFNFRGTGLSEGSHDGSTEAEDVVAALHWIENAYSLPAVVIGFSFGAVMAIQACCSPRSGAHLQASVRALVALGFPLRAPQSHDALSVLSYCSLPKLFLSGDRDQFASAAELHQMAATTAEPKKLVLLPGADHFFAGQLEAMQNMIASWLLEQLR